MAGGKCILYISLFHFLGTFSKEKSLYRFGRMETKTLE